MRRMVAIFPKRESITDHPALTPIIAKTEHDCGRASCSANSYLTKISLGSSVKRNMALRREGWDST